MQVLFENDATDGVIVIANPQDISKYLGVQTNITTQTAFGMTYFQTFLDVKVMSNSSVPAGTFYATVADNLNLAYPAISGGEINKAFSFTTDATGLVGITHTADYTRANYETTILTGSVLFAERLDGVIVGTIATGA